MFWDIVSETGLRGGQFLSFFSRGEGGGGWSI